ncbi:unnamed protein product [Victoria cruziana]
MASLDDYSQDLEELRHLRSIAKRPRILSLISAEIASVENKISKAAAPLPISKAPNATASNGKAPAVNYTTLGSFSWDQDTDKLKLYVSLEGVDQEKVDAVFEEMSVDVKFHDVQGKNYRCAIPKLNKEIVPEKSRVTVKPNKVIITLHKASKGNWMDLHFKEDRLKPSADKEKDPMAGIMDLMKVIFKDAARSLFWV